MLKGPVTLLALAGVGFAAALSSSTGAEDIFARRYNPAPPQKWGADPVRGVNLGGWLVLEPWITPSLFRNKPDLVVDERTYGKHMLFGGGGIGDMGLNTVRIPIGYWALTPLLEGETFMVGAFEYLQKAVGWAKKVGLQVMIDLHGAPGGQNTWDNSGMRGMRHFYDNTTNMDRALNSLQKLMVEFNKAEWSGIVTSICILNEPAPEADKPEQLEFLKTFTLAAYSLIRDQSHATPSGGGIVVVISEAYQGLEHWRTFMPPPKYQRVVLDWHVYHMFEARLLDMTFDEHIDEYCNTQRMMVRNSNANLWTIVGEFSVAPTDCAASLLGDGAGSQWHDGRTGGKKLAEPNNCEAISKKPETWTHEYRNYLQRSWETQTYVYELGAGWVYWTWKTEEAKDWALKDGFEGGWITRPGDRKLGIPCKGTDPLGQLSRFGLAERSVTIDRGVAGLTIALGGAFLAF